jgi:hypothetical protein
VRVTNVGQGTSDVESAVALGGELGRLISREDERGADLEDLGTAVQGGDSEGVSFDGRGEGDLSGGVSESDLGDAEDVTVGNIDGLVLSRSDCDTKEFIRHFFMLSFFKRLLFKVKNFKKDTLFFLVYFAKKQEVKGKCKLKILFFSQKFFFGNIDFFEFLTFFFSFSKFKKQDFLFFFFKKEKLKNLTS